MAGPVWWGLGEVTAMLERNFGNQGEAGEKENSGFLQSDLLE